MTPPSKPSAVLRTLTFRIRNACVLEEALDTCRHIQRVVYNAGIAACAQALTDTGRMPALHPDGLYGQLTRWRAEQPERFSGPLVLQRPALRQAHEAARRIEAVHQATVQRLLDEDMAWRAWRDAHPDFDSAAWDALSAQEKKDAVKTGIAPPRPRVTRVDERRDVGFRFRRRKTAMRCAVVWDTPPTRVQGASVTFPGLDEPVRVRCGSRALPSLERIRSASIVEARRGLALHLNVLTGTSPHVESDPPSMVAGDRGVTVA